MEVDGMHHRAGCGVDERQFDIVPFMHNHKGSGNSCRLIKTLKEVDGLFRQRTSLNFSVLSDSFAIKEFLLICAETKRADPNRAYYFVPCMACLKRQIEP